MQGTLEEGTEGKEHLVAVEWLARRSESPRHVYLVPRILYRCNHGPHRPHLFILRDARNFSNPQGLCNHMEWWELPFGCHAKAGGPQGEEETGDEAHPGATSTASGGPLN